MDDLLRSVPESPRTLQRKIISDFKATSNGDKIQNVLSIHHFEERHRSLDVDLKSNSVTTNQNAENKRVHKTFLFDSVSSKEDVCDDILISAIKRVAEKEDCFILSTSRGLRKKSGDVNRKLLQTLVNWLLEYLDVCRENSERNYSVRLSGLEINEEMDTIKELGSRNTEGNNVTMETQYCHRCVDVDSATNVINMFHQHSQHEDHSRHQYLYTIHVYQQEKHCSLASTVSSNCSRLFLLLMDLTKQKQHDNCLSPSSLAKLLTASLNRERDEKKNDFQTKFQSMLSDIVGKYSDNFAMITQISMKEKHISDTYQLLQLASRIQRLKVKYKKYRDFKDGDRQLRVDFATKGDKYSDTEISCAETVIFIGEEHRRNSDDELSRFRSQFMSSDSDSGYRDWKLSQSGGSRGATPINEAKKQIRHRTNALIWPKSAIRMAKTALLTGQELWVDGPHALERNGHGALTNLSESTISTPETIKHTHTSCHLGTKQDILPQDTHLDDQDSEEVIRRFQETTEENDTLKNCKGGQNGTPSRNDQFIIDLERNDVKNLSNWIHDVNELTSYQEFLTRSQHENVIQNRHFVPVRNESLNCHGYQYYDHGGQEEYNCVPQMYNQIHYSPSPVYNPISVRCCNTTPRFDKKPLPSPTDVKLSHIIKKKELIELNCKDKYVKPKSFSPLELLKKTLMRKKKKEMPEGRVEVQSSAPYCPELTYLMPAVHSPEESSDSTSSESECNEWFRKVKTFKSKPEYAKSKCSEIRPPSAPLLAGCGTALPSQYSHRQRSSSSGYGSIVTRDSEISSHHDSTSDQSIHISSLNMIKQSVSFSHPTQNTSDDLDPDIIAKRCEALVKQEKAFLLIQQQEMMIQEFYKSTRPLLTNDSSKYSLRVSAFEYNRVSADNQYLEELEEDTNIIRDSIAFYKSLVHLESSFITSPNTARRNIP